MEVAELLLKNEANPNLQNSFDNTALDVANRKGNVKIMHLLENRANADSAETIVTHTNKTSIPIYCSESPALRFVETVHQKQKESSGATRTTKGRVI